jgi:hypothetical protein
MAIFGRGSSSNDSDSGSTGGGGSSNQRASVFGQMPEHGWGWRMGFRACKSTSTNATARLAVYETTGGDPDDRIGYTDSFTISNLGSSAGDCSAYTALIENTSNDSPTQSGLMLWSGRTLGLAFSHTGGPIIHQMAVAADVNYANEQLYRKDNGSSIPSDPFGASTVSIEGMITIWLEYEPNVAPSTPTGLSPTGTITSTTPTFTSTFSDSNSDRGDALKEMQIQVRQGSSSGTLKWDATVDTDDIAYNGSALSAGITYVWRCRHFDQFGAASSWTSWQTFTINAGGHVNQPSAPTGKLENITPANFTAQWTHASGLSTNAYELRIKEGSTVIRGPVQISGTVTNGNNINITWAQSGFSNLGWGKSYTVEMRARDTGNVWSDWSTPRSFTTNAYPTVPSGMTPTNSQVLTAVPLLRATSTDADDTTATGLSVTARIKDNAGAVIQSRTMTYNSSTGKWEYQTVLGVAEVQRLTRAGTISGGSFTITVPANDLGPQSTTAAIAHNVNAAAIQAALELLPNVGSGNVIVTGGPVSTTNVDITFTGALRGYNLSQITHTSSLTGGGTLTPSTITAGSSNDIPRFGTYKWDARSTDGTLFSDYSSEKTFIYGNGPTVTGTYPTEALTITTNTPVITWNVTGQVKYRVYIYRSSDDELVYDSGQITSAVQSHAVPTGYLFNNTTYYYIVTVTNSVPLDGSSAAVSFDVAYPPLPTVANFLASPLAVEGDSAPTAILLSWEAAPDPPSTFDEYTITRTDLHTSETIILARITSIQQVTFIDYFPASEVTYEYTIYKTIRQGSDEPIISPPTNSEATITIPYPILVSVNSADHLRAALRLLKDFVVDQNDDVAYYLTWGAEEPTAAIGAANYESAVGSFDIIDDNTGTAEQKVKNLKDIRDLRNIVCYRDERKLRIFATMKLRITYQSLRKYIVTLTLTEVNFTEGVT